MKAANCLIIGALTVAIACYDAPTAPAPEPVAPSSSHQFGEGWIFREGEPVHVGFEIIGGRAIFEGDIDLGPAEAIAPTFEALIARPPGVLYGVVRSSSAYRWPGGKVPYEIAPDFPDQWRVVAAIDTFHLRTNGLTLVPRQPQDNRYIRFVREFEAGICGRAAVGMQPTVGQDVTVADHCGVGTVLHEMGHALGFWHEQSRCDRPNFVEVHWNNIHTNRHSAFSQYCAAQGAMDVSSYNEASIMHYRRFIAAWSVDPTQPVMSSKRGLDHLMGNRDSLTVSDRLTVNFMYPPGPVDGSVSYPSGTPTISWLAARGASGYWVNLVIEYKEFDDYSGTSEIYDVESTTIGSTTGLSLTDTQRSYTGRNDCMIYQETWGSAGYYYWYEIWPLYNDPAMAPPVVIQPARRMAADVAPSYPPCY